MSTWYVKHGSVYLDSIGGPDRRPPRWGSVEDATRYANVETARALQEVYGGHVVKRTRVSFKARAERAEAEVARLRAALEALVAVVQASPYPNNVRVRDGLVEAAVALRSTSAPATEKK